MDKEHWLRRTFWLSHTVICCAGTLGKGTPKRSEQQWVTGVNQKPGNSKTKKLTLCCVVRQEDTVGVRWKVRVYLLQWAPCKPVTIQCPVLRGEVLWTMWESLCRWEQLGPSEGLAGHARSQLHAWKMPEPQQSLALSCRRGNSWCKIGVRAPVLG